MSGAFGKELSEMLHCVLNLPADHPYLAGFLEGVLIDHNLDQQSVEHLDPQFQKALLLDNPFAQRETVFARGLARRVEIFVEAPMFNFSCLWGAFVCVNRAERACRALVCDLRCSGVASSPLFSL